MRNSIISKLMKMQSGEELKSSLTNIHQYKESFRMENDAFRLMALNELYSIYLPSEMSFEIYSKLYLALLRSLQKKETMFAVSQRYENFKAIQRSNYSGIIGGSDSFTIIGTSGIGKSSAIDRAIALISQNQIIEMDEPYTKIIPCITTQCPHDSSVKGLLLDILHIVDSFLGSKHYENAIRARATTDMLIGSVSQVALNHIGLLVVDEIQNICNHRNGSSLVAMLTQLINNSGISVCMVGTPESATFFTQAMQLARRSLGLQYSTLPYDLFFREFCKTVFSFQYVKQRTELTDVITEWLYEHSGGIVSIVVSLIHDAQEIAILTKKEVLNLTTLNEAYQKRMNMLHNYLNPSIIHNRQISKRKKVRLQEVKHEIWTQGSNSEIDIVTLADRAKKEKKSLLGFLSEHFSIEEVKV